jgi:hypothetical protein
MLRFPPFPVLPDGVTLLSFNAFRPSGIRVPIDDDDDPRVDGIEVDGLGIPTIALRVKHVADNAEKKKKRKKKGGAAMSVQVAPERPKTWWEVWEDLEDIRRNAYNVNETPIDRLCQAGVEFKNGRTWPSAQHGVQHVWDIFRIYIGLLQQVPGPVKEATPDVAADARSDDSDMEEDDAGSSGDQDDVVNRLESFLNDPELSMKIFFSSYFREKGLIWSEPRCQATPILISFFLRYLIRSRVFPEPEYERPIKRALEITELARIELPNSWKLGRALPDTFSDGCRGLWGSKQSQWVPPADDPSPELMDIDERPDDSDADASSPNLVDADIAAAAEPNPGGWGTATDEQDIPEEGWGTNDGWDAAHAADDDDDDDPNPLPSEHLPPIVETQPSWELEPTTLLPLLGPTALPLTHTTGVVEQSTRRIVRVEPPRAPRLLAQNASLAEAVEEDLACRFARVVLAPWERLDARTYEVGTDVLPPTVLSASSGVVVLDEEEGESPAVVGAHRAWKDEIGVLVNPKLTDVFVAGMGLGAIWVEIVRDPEAGTVASKNAKGKKKEVPKYWYMEQLVHQLPSFYLDDKPEVVM